MPGARKKLILENDFLWYFIGLITADGCLISDGRHINITSKSIQYLEDLRLRAGLTGRIAIKNRGFKNESHQLHFSNVLFYDFLLSVGLTPKKSLTLGAMRVPNQYFHDFLRGVIDGDGNIQNWIHPSNRCEQWSLRVYSSSERFIVWLQQNIAELWGAKGRLHKQEHPLKNVAFVLKYGKRAAKIILRHCYYQQAFALGRKASLANMCLAAGK